MHFPPARTTTHYKTLHQTKPGQIVPNKPHKMHFPPDQAKCISHQIKQNTFPTRSSKMHFPPDQAKYISHQIKQNAFPTRSSKMHFPPDQTKCISHLPGLLHLLGHEATAVQLTLSHVPSPEDTIFVSFSCNCFCTSKIIFTFLQALQAGRT